MEIVKLKSPTKNYIWGGNRLFNYGKVSDDLVIAESWELSFHEAGLSVIDSGINKGKYLKDVVTNEDLGTKISNFPFFPILIKLIDAKNDLSIQVHPSDDYALKYENSFGKTEMWYVVEADEGALLHIGLNKNLTKEEFVEAINDNTILKFMNHIPVHAGDCYFIPSGTLHAIGKGCFICEIQENSNLTYRVYDYGRLGNDGKPRELHVEKAIRVTNLNKMIPNNQLSNPLADCNYFNVNKVTNPSEVITDSTSFAAITFLSGNGTIGNLEFSKGDTIFIPSNKKVNVKGECTAIVSRM